MKEAAMSPTPWTTLKTLAALGAFLLLAACQPFTLVPPQTASVAKASLSVTPTVAWNKQTTVSGLHSSAEVWTLDGPILSQVTFFGPIKDGETLIRPITRAETKPPLFKSGMLPQDVVEFVEKSYRVQSGSPVFTITNLKPAQFGGEQGFQFDFDFVTRDEVRRKGRAAGAIRSGQLYLIIYEAAAVHYFERGLPEVDKLIGSARIL
jgi:hypothetical protein